MALATREQANLIWFAANLDLETLPGDNDSAGEQICRILVPFPHSLREAWFGCDDINNSGTITATLKQADSGDAKAGTTVGTALSDTDLAATSDTFLALQITLAASDKAVVTAGRFYFITLVGTNSSDLVDNPMLSIGVLPNPIGGVVSDTFT